jgi:hypothetical protein
MGFGAFGKETRLHGGGFWDKLKGFGQKIISGAGKVLDVAGNLVGTVAAVADTIKPGLGGAINTGFSIADGITGSLKRGDGGTMSIDPGRLAKFNSEHKGMKRSGQRENLKVNSILNKRLSVPKRAQVYDSDEDNSEEVEDSSE